MNVRDLKRARIATHEAGHALNAQLCPTLGRLRFSYADEHDGETSFRSVLDGSLESHLDVLTIIFGGMAAEHVIYGDDQGVGGAVSDILAAIRFLPQLFEAFDLEEVLRDWSEEDVFPDSVMAQISITGDDPGLMLTLALAYRRARKRIETHRRAFDLIRASLVLYGAIDGRKIASIVTDHPPTPKGRP